MPKKSTVQRARRKAREGKSPSTQAGEFVREEIHHVREGKHPASSPEQVIAIGLSKARRAGVKLPPAPEGRTKSTRPKGGRGRSSASTQSLARHARKSARQRGPTLRRRAAQKAVRTKGQAGRRRVALEAARTRRARGK